MMQHRGMNGVAIGATRGMSFEEIEAEARLARLEEAARIIHADSPWFALRVMTGRESSVQEALETLGITSLVPQRKGPDARRRRRIIAGVLEPVIHGYVMIQSDPAPDILVAFKGVPDVLGVLGGAEKPMRVTAKEISRFKAMAEAGAYDWEAPSDMIVTAGEKMKVKGGPFDGFDAVAVTPSTKGKGDVVVSINVFGRETAVTLPLAMLEKL